MDPDTAVDQIIDGLVCGDLDSEDLIERVDDLYEWINAEGFDPEHPEWPELLCALFWGFNDCHRGQFSDEYRALSQVSTMYQPGMCEGGPEDDSFASELYASIVEVL